VTFGAPAWLLGLPLLVAGAVWLGRRGAAARAALPGAIGAARTPDRRAWCRRFEGTGGALLLVGLALPRCDAAGGAAPKPAVVVVDVSRSMLAEDEAGSRFSRANEAIDAALASLAGRRVGLIAFAGASEEVAPPTPDHSALRALLGELDPRRTLDPGSLAAPALEAGLERLKGGGDLLVVSDGEWEGEARRELELAANAVRRGVAIHVVPLGGAAPVGLVERETGGALLPLVDGEGRNAVTRADRRRMVALAESARGRVVEDPLAPHAFAFLAARSDEAHAPASWPVALVLALALLALAHGIRERVT